MYEITMGKEVIIVDAKSEKTALKKANSHLISRGKAKTHLLAVRRIGVDRGIIYSTIKIKEEM